MNLKNVIFGGSVTGVSDRSGAYEGSIQAWLPIKDIVQGVVVTRDKRFVKVLELLPVNFYTMSSMDKSAAIEDFAAYLKIAPANLQINVLTQPFDLNGYLKLLKGYLEQETNERCRAMLEESIEYVPQLVKREALTHRFFLSFSYDPSMKAADHTPEAIAAVLNEKAEVARRYLDRCGVAVLEPEYADNFILDLFYKIINKHTSQHIRLPDGVFDMLGMVHGIYDEDTLKALETEAAAPSGKKKRKLFSRNKTISPLSRLEAGATLDQVLVYEGEFVWGEATGTGRIYHPSGQLLYEGQVFEGQPRADAFLGLSLADVESAFKEHWILYSYEGITAFVYPYFHLMFVTEIPVQLVSPSEQEAKTEQERQELLEAIAAQTTQLPSPEEATDQEMVAEEPETATAQSILATAAAKPIADMELSQDTVKSDLLISEVLSYGAPLAGVSQPTSNLASGTHKAGWREWFSDYAADKTVIGAVALQTGPYIYEFTALTSVTPPDSEYYLASDRGVMSSTVHRDWKDNPVWYQSAVRRDEP